MILSSRGLVSTARCGGALPFRSQAGDIHPVRRGEPRRPPPDDQALCHDRASVHRHEIVLTGLADSVFRARLFELAPIMAWWAS